MKRRFKKKNKKLVALFILRHSLGLQGLLHTSNGESNPTVIYAVCLPRLTGWRTSWWPSRRSSRPSPRSWSRPSPRCPATRPSPPPCPPWKRDPCLLIVVFVRDLGLFMLYHGHSPRYSCTRPPLLLRPLPFQTGKGNPVVLFSKKSWICMHFILMSLVF